MQGNSCSIAQRSGEICAEQRVLQPILVKSDRLHNRSKDGHTRAGFMHTTKKPSSSLEGSDTTGENGLTH